MILEPILFPDIDEEPVEESSQTQVHSFVSNYTIDKRFPSNRPKH